MKAAEFRQRIEEEGKLAAARRVKRSCGSEEEADALIRLYVHTLLENKQYLGAAVVLWGRVVFDARPRSVQQVLRGIEKYATTLIQGCASAGKSYSVIAWLLLDWWRDPEFTSIKIISSVSKHTQANTFSTLTKLHQEAVVKMPGQVFSEHIGLDESTDRRSAISIVKIPAGEDGKGRLQGFHPIPRQKPHPTLGATSRVRVMLDEAETIPIGVWIGVDNLLSNLNGIEPIKVVGAYNPEDQASKVAQLAEPKGGWPTLDPETADSWESKQGWHVERIDGKKLENVKEKRVIFEGQQTYEAYRRREQKQGGNSPEHWTMGRGWYPPQGVANSIISPDHYNACKGTFTFLGDTIKFAGVDVAVDGRDDAVFTVGRFGKAVSFQHENGRLITFPEPRMAAQVDQQIELVKGSTRIVAHSIRDTAKVLQVLPENLDMDRTGNGATVHDFLCEPEIWSPEVIGTDFSKGASDMKILDQDRETAEEIYDGSHTEVLFALARWMEAGYIAISPAAASDRLNTEVPARKYKQLKKLLRALKKDEMKLLFGTSPDYLDSLSLFLNGIRKRMQALGSMTGKAQQPTNFSAPIHGPVDVPKFVDFSGV